MTALPGWRLLTAAIPGTPKQFRHFRIEFIGTTDAQALRFRINNQWANFRFIGRREPFMAFGAGKTSNGFSNSAFGYKSLNSNTTGSFNSAFGYRALNTNTTGRQQPRFPEQNHFSNTTGTGNTGSGYRTLFANSDGNSNTATSYSALTNNTNGDNNTASGYQAFKPIRMG